MTSTSHMSSFTTTTTPNPKSVFDSGCHLASNPNTFSDLLSNLNTNQPLSHQWKCGCSANVQDRAGIMMTGESEESAGYPCYGHIHMSRPSAKDISFHYIVLVHPY